MGIEKRRVAYAILSWIFLAGPLVMAEDGPERDSELHLLSDSIDRQAFLRHARESARPRSALYERDLEVLRRFLGDSQPIVAHWHQVYEGIQTSLRREGRQIALDGIVGFAAGIGVRVGLGIEDRALVRRPHAFVQLLWAAPQSSSGQLAWSHGALGGIATVTTRHYQSPMNGRTGAPPAIDDETRSAVIAGLTWGDSTGEVSSEIRGLAVGLGHVQVGAAPLITLEIPAFFWPLPNDLRALVRRALLAEYDLIFHTQRLDYALAERARGELRGASETLRARLGSRLTAATATTALGSAHPLASVTSLLGESAVRRYQRGPIARFFSRCAIRLGWSG